MNYIDTIRARLEGRQPTELELDFPTVYDGARGVRFMEQGCRERPKRSQVDPFLT